MELRPLGAQQLDRPDAACRLPRASARRRLHGLCRRDDPLDRGVRRGADRRDLRRRTLGADRLGRAHARPSLAQPLARHPRPVADPRDRAFLVDPAPAPVRAGERRRDRRLTRFRLHCRAHAPR